MKVKKIPQRMCVGCQEMRNKRDMVRVVRTPEGEVLIDKTGKKSGRGAYVCMDAACIGRARKEKRLEKALEKAIGDELYQNLLLVIEK
ncbi:MAG: YlxR family protein [Acidaminococcales bacterium]|jgi:predicted RNA-binding protein YlxR (DUF448 family)|nr:YlxR family protein [Acidaminococcales bacterium]